MHEAAYVHHEIDLGVGTKLEHACRMAGRSGRIVVVDDHADTRRALAALLEEEGFDVVTARNGLDALRSSQSLRPELVVSDLFMPGIDGLELTKQLRALTDPPDVIVMTGASTAESAVSVLRAGGADYLFKPINFDELLIVIDRVLERRRLQRERRQTHEAERFLLHASQQLGASLESATVVNTVATLGVPLLGDGALLDLVTAEGRASCVAWAHRSPSVSTDLSRAFGDVPRAPLITTPLDDVIATRHSSSSISSEGWFAHADRPLARRLGIRAAMTVPLAVGVRCFGALTLFRADDRPYAAHELALAEEFGRRAALAIEHARLYEQAREAVAQRDRTLAIVTHDLRSPLQTIALAAASLREAETKASRWTRHGLEHIQRAADRMNRLIGDLADFESIAAGRLSVVTSPHMVATIVEESVSNCAGFAARRNIALTSEVASGLPRVQCDRDRVLQVIGNLVDNAIKISSTGDSVSVRAGPLDDEVVFSVSDTGPGISLADQVHLFDRYWRGPNSRYSGTGLGLAISRAIVEAHRGRIWVESEPGRGTTFRFTMPVAAPALVPAVMASPDLSIGPQ